MLLNISFSKFSGKLSQFRHIVNQHKSFANFVAWLDRLVSSNTGLRLFLVIRVLSQLKRKFLLWAGCILEVYGRTGASGLL